MLFQFQEGIDFRKEKINVEMIKMDQNQENHTNIRQQDAQLIQSKSDSDSTIRIAQNEQRHTLSSKRQKNKKWNNQQYIRYMIFLVFHNIKYGDLIPGQKMKWYSLMSEALGNASYFRCGSNHRKFLQKFKNIEGILDGLKLKVCYKAVDLAEQVKRIRQIINTDHNNKIQILQRLLQQQSKKQHVKILNQLSINYLLQSSMQFNKIRETKSFIQQQNYTNQIRKKIIIPVELLIIVKRKTSSNDASQQIQMKQIDEITKKFENDKKIYRKMRSFTTRHQLKQSKNQIQKKNKVLHKIINYKQRKLNEQKIYQSQQIYKQIENQFSSKSTFKKQRTSWKKFQIIKFIVFFHIMKQKMQNQNLQKIDKINSKCVQYINTDKNLQDVKRKIRKLKIKYQSQFWSTGIEKEAVRLQIPQSYIEMEKQKYFQKEKNPPRCSLHLQCKKIELKVDSKLSQEDLNELIDKQLKQKFRMIVRISLNNFDREVLQKKKNQNEQQSDQNGEISSKKIKQILHLEFSKYLFQIYKNSFKFSHQTKNLLTHVIIKQLEIEFQ